MSTLQLKGKWKMKHTILLVALALLTTSCVPIHAEPLDSPDPRVPVGIRDLASVFSKHSYLDSEDPYDTDEYYTLLYEIIRCSYSYLSEEELHIMLTQGETNADHVLPLSSSEYMALTIFNLGIFVSSSQFAFLHDPPPESEPPISLEMYSLLELALEMCERE